MATKIVIEVDEDKDADLLINQIRKFTSHNLKYRHAGAGITDAPEHGTYETRKYLRKGDSKLNIRYIRKIGS